MLELWQTEWCPASRRVRQRLTELGIDYVVRQVPVEKNDRSALIDATGTDSIPVLVAADRTVMAGEEAISAFLREQFSEPRDADTHRAKADRARRRYLEEECECLQAATR